MAARRLIVVMLALLVLSSIAAALVPVERDGDTTSSSTTVATPRPEGELVQRTLRADARKPQTIEIDLGDQLVLRVTSRRLVQVEIAGLGELADADPDAPARFDLLPPKQGTFRVRTLDPAREIGRIEVAPRKAGAQPDQDAPSEPAPEQEPAPPDSIGADEQTT